jgi:uncharacterized membrane protein YgcG
VVTVANRWLRLLRHRLVDEGDARRLFGAEALARIEARVAASERGHSGQIRVCIEAGLPWSYLRRGANARQRAVAMFGKLRVWDTEHDNGVLIYLLLAERRIEIVADRGLDRRVDAGTWERITESMAAAFRDGSFALGLDQAIDAVDARRRAPFPLAAGEKNLNELPDAPVIR